MNLTCGAKCAKRVLITFNLVFWISGCALITFGIFILVEEEKSTLLPLLKVDDSLADLQSLAIALIGIGGLVLVVGFFGYCGALQENKSMLIVYLTCLFIVLGCELAVGILAMLFQHQAETKLEGNLKEVLKNQYGVYPQSTKAIDLAQTKFQCCGIAGPSDYVGSTWIINEDSNKSVTPTCCILSNAKESMAYLNPQPINETLCQREDASNQKFRHQMGCMDKLDSFLKQESVLFIAIGWGIAALEIFGIIFSICQCRAI